MPGSEEKMQQLSFIREKKPEKHKILHYVNER